MKATWIFGLLIGLAACGLEPKKEDRRYSPPPPSATDQAIAQLQAQILALTGTQAQITSLVNSDFSSCPASGNTANQLINLMCKVAQASTVEARVTLESELEAYDQQQQQQIGTLNDSIAIAINQEATDITAANATIAGIQTSITTINTNIATLQTQMTSANSAITAIQAQLSVLSGAISGNMLSLDIGIENVSAGPLYETVLRLADKSRINAFIQAYGNAFSFAANPFAVVNASNVVTVTWTAHGLSVGQSVYLTGLTGSRGLTNTDINGYFVVASVVDANHFTFNTFHNATSTGTTGGSGGSGQQLVGQGLGTMWVTANGADVAVRVTSLGSQKYNFIILANGNLCYDKTLATQTFATINAQGANIVCK